MPQKLGEREITWMENYTHFRTQNVIWSNTSTINSFLFYTKSGHAQWVGPGHAQWVGPEHPVWTLELSSDESKT